MTERPEVLFYAPSLWPITGGGRVILDWATVAAGLGRRVAIATSDGRRPPWADLDDSVTVAARDAIRLAPELVLATIWWTAWHCAPWQRRGVRAAHLVQGSEHLWAAQPEQRRVVRAAYRVIPNKVCVSSWVAEACAAPGDEVRVVPPAVAVPIAGTRPRRDGPLVVGLPFRNLPEKGWEITEAVVDRLRASGARLRISVWGPEAPARLRGRYDKVHEPASDAELVQLYDACDVLLYTSWHDGFPLPPIEAMARGVAAVLTRSGGVVDYAAHGRNCLMSDPGDVEALAASVLRLEADPALLARLAEAGVETARRFSRERFAASARDVLTALAG